MADSLNLEWELDGYAFINAQEALEILHLQTEIEKMTGESPYGYVDVEHLTPDQGIMIMNELRETERLLKKALRRRGGT